MGKRDCRQRMVTRSRSAERTQPDSGWAVALTQLLGVRYLLALREIHIEPILNNFYVRLLLELLSYFDGEHA